MQKLPDLTGRKIGKVTVIKENGRRGGHIMWLCRCECGTEKDIRGDRLRSGASVSCGCHIRELRKRGPMF